MYGISYDEFRDYIGLTLDSHDARIAQTALEAAAEFVDQYLEKRFADYLPDSYDPVTGDYTPGETVPQPLKQAIFMLAAHMFENREAYTFGDQIAEPPFGFWDLVAPYRKWAF